MVKLLRSFLINTIYIFNSIVKFFFHKHDFTVVSRQIEYRGLTEQDTTLDERAS